jgi:hypothetical protein
MVMTILITNEFHRQGQKSSCDEVFGTGSDEDSVVVTFKVV